MANFVKSHSFIIRKANGTDDFRIQLRASYWETITSERKLRRSLEHAFETHRDPIWAAANKKIYDAGNVLQVLRNFGMIAASERITGDKK